MSFEEKPAAPRSDLANAGIYAFRRSVLDLVPDGDARSTSAHTCSRGSSAARSPSHVGDAFLIDIGTPEALARAEAEWPRRGVA